MTWWSRVRSWLHAILRRSRMETEMDAELRFHIEAFADDLVRSGVPRQEAYRRARIEFGGIERGKEECRDALGAHFLHTLFQDLRFGLRMLRKNSGFTAVVVITLALGIGANTAIFTLIDGVLLKMLPVKNPQELVLFQWSFPIGQEMQLWMDGSAWPENGKTVGTPFSYPAFQQIRSSNQAFSDIFALADLGNHMNVVADGEPGLAHGKMASGNIFTTLGLSPVVGRFFAESDDRPGAPPVCVISHGYWMRRFGGGRGIAGKHVAIAGVPFTIVGVTPPKFFGLETGFFVDIWVPLSTQPLVAPNMDPKVSMFTAADHWWVVMMARLKPGVTAERASVGLNVIFKAIAAQGISPQPGQPLAIPSLQLAPASTGLHELERRFSRSLFVLMGLVAVVLLVACANVANLLLARATSRQREIGVRLSLGASRSRLIRQLLAESVLLACIGGALGYVLAYWGSGLLVALISPASDPLSLNLSPDLSVLGFTATACLITGILFGLAPAWRATRTDLTAALKQNPQSISVGGLRLGLGKGLVISQIALSFVLLFGAGLFVRTLVNLKHLDTGFDKENVLLFGLNPTKSGYKEAALNDFYSRVQQRIASLPGVVSATASYHLLLGDGARSLTLSVPAYTPKLGEDLSVHVLPVGPDFLTTMKIPLLRGRDFTEGDHEHAPKVAVVNQAFAKLYFSGLDPLVNRIGLGADHPTPDIEIIGLVEGAKYDSLREASPPTVYQPIRQASDIPYMYFEVRTAMNPLALVPAVRSAVALIDSNVPLFGVQTETEQIDELLLQERLFAKLTTFFSLVALLLACAGLYGTLSYAVGRRTNEIGIRMAVGASGADISWMVLRESLLLVLAGLSIGLLAAIVASRLISSMLFGLAPMDPVTILVSIVSLATVTGVAAYLPARRATRVDPMVALRYE